MTVTTLASFQDDYAAESRVELVSSRPPSFRDANTGIIQEAESAMVGMNLSGALVKPIDVLGDHRGQLSAFLKFCKRQMTCIWLCVAHCGPGDELLPPRFYARLAA